MLSNDTRADAPAGVKAALRARFRAVRAGLDEPEYARRSAAIVARLRRLPEVEAARIVHVYWPVTRRREVDVRPLIIGLHAEGKQVVLPVVRTFGGTRTDLPLLDHARFDGEEGLRANIWGLLEPSGGETVPIQELDLVIVPALGAGRNGHRIGHGFGYYDGFLRALTVPRVGAVYADCLVEAVPPEPHDVPLTVIVTEDEVVRPAFL